ncbi:MAG: RluA family pseudouridine synthase, partial [Lachnospiraceae bacterium]|nr:RluA family pseudouridine synthase [Lachnospiraceae bacterium]
MERFFEYELKEADLQITIDGIVGQVIKNCLKLKAHEWSHAKYTKGGVTVIGIDGNVRSVYANEKMTVGERVRVRLTDPPQALEEHRVEAVEGELQILYEDEDLLIVNKPAGIVVHPCFGHYYDTISNIVAYYYENKGLDVICRSIGRLDRETSGALLFAKNKASAGRLFNQREIGTSGRTYHAIVQGWVEKDFDTINKPIEPIPGVKLLRRTCEEPDGQSAVTHYKVLTRAMIDDEKVSFIEANIDTGRTHQIRVHMQSIGHPLLGDLLYGYPEKNHGFERALLHAVRLKCKQPFTEKEIEIYA